MRHTLTIVLLCLATFIQAQQYHFSLSSLFEHEEMAYFDPPNAYSALEGGLMLKASGVYGQSVLRYGWFVDYIPTNYVYRYDYDLEMISLGGIIGAAFDANDQIQIQALGEIGYRNSSLSLDLDSYSGLAINLNINGIYWLDGDFHPKANIGFQTQPDGGNSDVFFSYSPQWYIGIGVVYSN
jgi:hypothetical protein